MTKFQIFSDLHSEFYLTHEQVLLTKFIRSLNPKQEERIALVAGDLATRTSSKDVYNILSDTFSQVVTVAGNHDFWHSDSHPEVELDKLRSETKHLANLHILEDQTLELEGHHIHGCTGWFSHDRHTNAYKYMMPDFRQIQQFTPWVYQRNMESREFLNDNVKPGDIVIMHHIPITAMVAPRWRKDPTNRFFVAGFDNLPQKDPGLIVYGHTHDSTDHQVGSTHYVCNPYGYHKQGVNPDFKKELIVNL